MYDYFGYICPIIDIENKMKRFSLTLFALCAAFLMANSQQKTHLTDAQIAMGRLPEGIINQRTGDAGSTAGQKVEAMPQLVDGWQNPTYSPDRTRIAYTLGGDLYTIEVATKKVHRCTYDGTDLIMNGYASWVYYEEIFGRPSRYRAFWWSPDSKILAFYRFDDTQVPMFPIYLEQGQHGTLRQTHYPMAGDPNPEVRIGFASVEGNAVVWADFNEKDDQYFGTPFWNNTGDRLIVPWMDRSQDNMIFYSVDPLYGGKEKIYSEHQDTWIEWPTEMLFSSKGMYFVRDYEMWQKIYFLSFDGKTFSYVCNKDLWGVQLLKANEKYLFFSARSKECTVRTDIYRVTLKDLKLERVSYGEYNFTNISISDDCRTVYATLSNSTTPAQDVAIHLPAMGSLDRKKVEVLFDSKGKDYDKYAIATQEVVYITLRDGRKLPATVIWPLDMDRSGKVKYPVKVDVYGGPDTPQVWDTFKGVNFKSQWWANHGVIQVVLDTRSSGHFGKAGLNEVYRQLGVLELQDIEDGLKYFTKLPYVNADKVGIEGFSYGGTMSMLAVTEGNEYFKYAVSGAGVLDWRLYDSHYTERYMDRPQDNPEGYEKSAVINRLRNYKGDKTNMMRMTHGSGDDNVHFQNSLQAIDKLMSMNKDFEFMVYPSGMHGYHGYQGRHFDLQNYRFWYEYLLDQELPEVLRQR